MHHALALALARAPPPPATARRELRRSTTHQGILQIMPILVVLPRPRMQVWNCCATTPAKPGGSSPSICGLCAGPGCSLLRGVAARERVQAPSSLSGMWPSGAVFLPPHSRTVNRFVPCLRYDRIGSCCTGGPSSSTLHRQLWQLNSRCEPFGVELQVTRQGLARKLGGRVSAHHQGHRGAHRCVTSRTKLMSLPHVSSRLLVVIDSGGASPRAYQINAQLVLRQKLHTGISHRIINLV